MLNILKELIYLIVEIILLCLLSMGEFRLESDWKC